MSDIQHKNPVTSVRLPEPTRKQIDELTAKWGCSMANILTIAIDRMHREEIKTMNAAQARKLAIEAIEHADAEGEPVAQTTVVGKDEYGYWVTDNGEEVSGLSKEKAIEIIVENLTAAHEVDE